MTDLKQEIRAHPKESELADYLSNTLNGDGRKRVEDHIACCNDCLDSVVSAHESVKTFKKGKPKVMKKINICFFIFFKIKFVKKAPLLL